eukprot:6013547-Amphidinium_carterae.1
MTSTQIEEAIRTQAQLAQASMIGWARRLCRGVAGHLHPADLCLLFPPLKVRNVGLPVGVKEPGIDRLFYLGEVKSWRWEGVPVQCLAT